MYKLLGGVREPVGRGASTIMERKLVGVLFTIFGLIFWAGAAAATPAGTVVGVSGSCTDHGRALNRGDVVQIGDTLDVPAGGNLKL